MGRRVYCSVRDGSSPLTRGKRGMRTRMRGCRRLIPAHAGKTRACSWVSRGLWAHPRSRGENIIFKNEAGDRMGSSPLTRGKPGFSGDERVGRGLIPAHAGKTPGSPRTRAPPWAHPRSRGENTWASRARGRDAGSSPLTRGKLVGLLGRRLRGVAHPRSRGENSTKDSMIWPAIGSSPLTRGKRRLPGRCHRRNGLIPAHAGKTDLCEKALIQHGAHPRSRGENEDVPRPRLIRLGSSPLTRGKLCSEPRIARCGRLIPAHAGKTPRRVIRDPRPSGSSPLTRGKRYPRPLPRARPGLIPAHAGKTPGHAHLHGDRRAHPRSRGENCSPCKRGRRQRGSSPLTRGKPKSSTRQTPSHGLIPAHAGKTWLWVRVVLCVRAHPRSRGENLAVRVQRRAETGSSPLTRGKHNLPPFYAVGYRLIPAHAGKTVYDYQLIHG